MILLHHHYDPPGNRAHWRYLPAQGGTLHVQQARGCELNDETVGSILAQGAGAIHELCDGAEQWPPLSDDKKELLD